MFMQKFLKIMKNIHVENPVSERKNGKQAMGSTLMIS